VTAFTAISREALVEKIGLVETIDALRTELAEAVAKGHDAEFQFPVAGIQMEFNVTVTRDTTAEGGIKLWVVSLGGGASAGNATTHKVVVNLEPPVDRAGRSIQVHSRSAKKP
jgi:hypothetical protein